MGYTPLCSIIYKVLHSLRYLRKLETAEIDTQFVLVAMLVEYTDLSVGEHRKIGVGGVDGRA